MQFNELDRGKTTFGSFFLLSSQGL